LASNNFFQNEKKKVRWKN